MTFLYSEVRSRYASDSLPAQSFAWSCTLGIEDCVYIHVQSLYFTVFQASLKISKVNLHHRLISPLAESLHVVLEGSYIIVPRILLSPFLGIDAATSISKVCTLF
jgi:hypothetical protein